MPISTAIRSLRQNSSSWFRRRATASNVPSSKKALFRLVMVPPKNRVGDAVTRKFVPALAAMSMIPRALNSIQQNGRFWDWWKSTVRWSLAGKAHLFRRAGGGLCRCLELFGNDAHTWPARSRAEGRDIAATVPYVFGETRVATLALLTFTVHSGLRSSGVVMTKFSGHAVTFRSSPTVCAETPRFWSASTRILSGKPPRAIWSAAVLLGLYRIRASLTARYQLLTAGNSLALLYAAAISLKGQLKQDSPPNNQGGRYQNGLVETQNFAATNCGVAVRGVQCAPNLNDALLKVIEHEPASPSS
jgi:hypothetical protein